MVIKIYKTDASPPVRATLMTLELLKLKYESQEVRPFSGEHKTPEYLALNPEHTVPFLEDGNFKLGDSHAIIIYLVSKYGGDQKEKLYPSDVETRATINHRLFLDAANIFQKIVGFGKETLAGKNPENIAKLATEIKEVYEILEIYLGRNEFFAANHLTLADISIVASISTLDAVVPVEGYPKLAAWFEKLKKYDWYQKGNAPGLAVITGFSKNYLIM